MRYLPIHAASRERVPFALWGSTRVRTALAAVAASAAALVPVVLVGSPAYAANTTSVNDLTITGGGAWAGGKVTFTLTYTGTNAGTFTLDTLATADGTDTDATGGGTDNGTTNDYLAIAGKTVTFPGTLSTGSNTTTVTVTTFENSDAVDGETFALQATDDQTVPGAGTKAATGTIWEPSATNTFSLVGSTTLPETAISSGGSVTQRTTTVTAMLTETATHDIVIPMETADSAKASDLRAVSSGNSNRDFTALASDASIVIPAGQQSGSITVSLYDDNVDEVPTQYFVVQPKAGGIPLGTAPTGGTQSVEIAVTDDDATPTVSIGDATSATEGSYLGFPIALSNPSEQPVTVEFRTGDGQNTTTSMAATGTGTADYTPIVDATSGSIRTVTIPKYNKTYTKLVTTTTAGGVEGPENMRATISSPSNATLGSPTTATGIILDSDTAPALITSNATAGADSARTFTEGNTLEVKSTIFVRLDNPATIPIRLDYKFSGGTATNGVDYKGSDGSVTIPASSTSSVEIPVTIVGDTLAEKPSETFDIVLSSPTTSVANLGAKTFTITDEDTVPTFTVGDASVTEGNSGTATAKVPVTLSAATNADVTFAATLASGSTPAVDTGTDYGDNDYDEPLVKTVTVPAGSTTANFEFPVNGDTVFEKDEIVNVTLAPTSTTNVNATPPVGSQGTAKLTIKNDDAAPKITFNEASGSEGTSLRILGTVVGRAQAPYDVKFTVAGSGTNPAASTDDFELPTIANVTIARGVTGALASPPLATIYLNPDNVDESTETFAITATEVTSSLVGFETSTGTYKVNDDPGDQPPAASITDESIGEWEQSVDVHVNLGFASDATSTTQTVSIPYWTVDGSAKAGYDYKATKGTLEVAPGTLAAKINVPVLDDKIKEGKEDFYVQLGTPTPSGATVARSTSEVIIKDNDTDSEPGGPSNPGAPSIDAPEKVLGAVVVSITGKAPSSTEVELWGAPVGGDEDLKRLATVESDEEGHYEFSRWIGQGYRFATQANEINSDEVTVLVQQKPVFVAGSPSRGMLNLAVQGNPRGSGQTVIVQRWMGGKWVNAWRGTTGSNNLWKAKVRVPADSTQAVRAFVAGYTPDGLLPGYSAVKRIAIK